MSKAVDLLTVMWPGGIPPCDYARAVSMVEIAVRDAPRQRALTDANRPSATSTWAEPRVSECTVQAVVSALGGGPMTTRELCASLGLSDVSVRAAVKRSGAIVVGTMAMSAGSKGRAYRYAMPGSEWDHSTTTGDSGLHPKENAAAADVATSGKYDRQYVSESGINEVRAAMMSGPLTVRELASAVRMNDMSIRSALHMMGAVVVGRVQVGDRRVWANQYALPTERLDNEKKKGQP